MGPTIRFIARFALTSVAASRCSIPHPLGEKNEQGYQKHVMRPCVTVNMGAVRDVLFGPYTPAGQIQMTIQNPDVAGELADLWTEFVKSEETEGPGPQFEVTFRLLEPHELNPII